MKKIKLLTLIAVFCASKTIAQQANTDFSDKLVLDKEKALIKFIPTVEGELSYQAYNLEITDFLKRSDNLEKHLLSQIKGKKDSSTELKKLDVDFYMRKLKQDYTTHYSWDSIGIVALNNTMGLDTRDSANLEKMNAAIKLAFPKRMSASEREKMQELIFANADVNNAELYKQSAAYRNWLSLYVKHLRTSKYKEDQRLGHRGNELVQLTIVRNEITNPYIRDYLSYSLVMKILKMVDNDTVVNEVYADFIKESQHALYVADVTEVYTNYQNMKNKVQAPDFEYLNIDGIPVSLKSLRGKYVYIDVWATWCGPCKNEIPYLVKLEEEFHGKDIHFVSLSVDRQKDKSTWEKYVREHNLKGIQLIADADFGSDFIKKFNINAIPRFILIDPSGMIVSGNAKRPSDPSLRDEFEQILK